MSEKKLTGKVAVIAGGVRGYALHLAGLGADIAIIERNLQGAEVYEFERNLLTAPTVVEEYEALGVRAMGIEADLTDRGANNKAATYILAELDRLGIAVSNAGGGTVTFADERMPERKGTCQRVILKL